MTETVKEQPPCVTCGEPADKHIAWIFTGAESLGPLCPGQLEDIDCYTDDELVGTS